MATKRRFTKADFKFIAEYVHEEWERRVGRRKHLDRVIKNIDRQVEMQPDIRHKLDSDGQRDPRKAWMPEVELPMQAEALETLMADARGMLFPDAGPWYTAHAFTTDEYLDRADFTSFIAGDENDVPSKITQDNADNLVRDLGNHWRRQYDFRGNMDLINAESFSYGMGLGRARVVTKAVFKDTARGMVREQQQIPVLVPRSIKNTYLDDRAHILMQEGFMVGPLEIFWKKLALKDVESNAKRGGRDPKQPNGGWMPRQIGGLEPDENGMVTFLEAEGDLLIPRSRENIFIPNVIVWVASGKSEHRVVRLQFRSDPFPSLIRFPYHRERIDTPYASSPLRKGWPLQAAAVDALTRTSEAAALSTQPPVSYDRNDLWFAERGGPEISPAAMWGTIGDVNVHKFGSPREMLAYYSVMTSQYADAVGIHRARLGAQTVSHTTAFAKNAELQRGAVRTVDYVRATLQGPLAQWLDMEYRMGLRAMGRRKTAFYSDSFKGFVEVTRPQMPDEATFEAHGAGGPAEEQAKRERRSAALAQALEMDQLLIQQGQNPNMTIREMQEQVLHDGGWPDVDVFFAQEDAAALQGPPPDVLGSDLIGPIPEPL